MFDFDIIPVGNPVVGGEALAVLVVEGLKYQVGFGANIPNCTAGICSIVLDDKTNLLRSEVQGTVYGFNYNSVWSAYP